MDKYIFDTFYYNLNDILYESLPLINAELGLEYSESVPEILQRIEKETQSQHESNNHNQFDWDKLYNNLYNENKERIDYLNGISKSFYDANKTLTKFTWEIDAAIEELLSSKDGLRNIKTKRYINDYQILFDKAVEIIQSGIDGEMRVNRSGFDKIPPDFIRKQFNNINDRISKKKWYNLYLHLANITLDILDKIKGSSNELPPANDGKVTVLSEPQPPGEIAPQKVPELTLKDIFINDADYQKAINALIKTKVIDQNYNNIIGSKLKGVMQVWVKILRTDKHLIKSIDDETLTILLNNQFPGLELSEKTEGKHFRNTINKTADKQYRTKLLACFANLP